MTIGVCSFEIHIPDAQSLKDKRRVVRRVKERLRARHNVAVSETSEHAELWQRAELVVVSVATNRDVLARLFEAVQREAEANVPGLIILTGSDFIEATDAGPTDWSVGDP